MRHWILKRYFTYFCQPELQGLNQKPTNQNGTWFWFLVCQIFSFLVLIPVPAFNHQCLGLTSKFLVKPAILTRNEGITFRFKMRQKLLAKTQKWIRYWRIFQRILDRVNPIYIVVVSDSSWIQKQISPHSTQWQATADSACVRNTTSLLTHTRQP